MTIENHEKIERGLCELMDWAVLTSDLLQASKPAMPTPPTPCAPLFGAGYVECAEHASRLLCRHACEANPCDCAEYLDTQRRIGPPQS